MFNVEELVDEGTEEAFVVYKQNCDLQPLDFDLESVIRFIGVLTNKNSQEDKLRYFRRNLGVPLNDATIFMIASLASKKIYYTIDQLMKDFGTLYYYATDGDIIEEDFEPDEYE
ncbi:hypothetical protein SS50377_20200 [Spironucleus salmonicida]|uniref:Uncharacterized protein n=1 Tax=Spironucleus salmonicida TaxID=348837 RepID=V6LKU8_9EUKA|nr:hypothetical protein SS50377_20200 [Spironucleus salmonicida]|eukprot:EST45255.1 Hypothetical protein SS50377_14831 [Spironucleus salmonicida]